MVDEQDRQQGQEENVQESISIQRDPESPRTIRVEKDAPKRLEFGHPGGDDDDGTIISEVRDSQTKESQGSPASDE